MLKINSTKLNKIVLLRRRGRSIPEISNTCGVSKSTALRYAKNITMLPRYRSRWLKRRNASKIISERNWRRARIKIKEMVIICACLYWGEGTKADFSISNTDPKMIEVIIKILKSAFGVQNSDFKISIRLYKELNINKSIKFWSKITGIKLDKNVSINIIDGTKKRKLKYGMCRIRVRRGGYLLKQMFVAKETIYNLI